MMHFLTRAETLHKRHWFRLFMHFIVQQKKKREEERDNDGNKF